MNVGRDKWRCWIAAVLNMLIVAAGCRPPADSKLMPNTNAGAPPRSPDAIVHDLARDDRVSLSTLAASTPQFSFVVEGYRGKPMTKVFEVETAVAGTEVAAIVRAGNGMPFAFTASGLCAVVDTDRPGKLLIVEAGAPDLQLHAREGSMVWQIRHAKRERPHVEADVASVLAAMLPYDALRTEEGRLCVLKGQSRMTLDINAAGSAGYPLNEWWITNSAGMALAMRSVRIGAAAELPVKLQLAKLIDAPERTEFVREEPNNERPVFPPIGFPADHETFIASSLLQAALAGDVQPAFPAGEHEQARQTTKMGIALQCPKGWTIQREDGSMDVLSTPDESGQRACISIATLAAPKEFQARHLEPVLFTTPSVLT